MAEKRRIADFDPAALEAEQESAETNLAGQTGDTQGLSTAQNAASESVTELAEEGQYLEAAAVSGIEDAPPADVAEVRTRQIRVDDVPLEYLDDDREHGDF